jgi:8-oxo-dGTP diphosphatase
MAIHKPRGVPCCFLGSAYETSQRRAGAWVRGWGGRGEAIIMSRAGEGPIAADSSPRRRVVVDVILLIHRNGRILLRERANTGYGDGAYEPPSGQLADRETIVETAIRVASAAGIVIGAENVSLAHVMHDVSGSGRIAFFLSVSGWVGQPASPDVRWFPVGNLPTNMLDRARVALRHYADGMRFSTYPAFAPAGNGGTNGFHVVGRSSGSNGSNGPNGPNGPNGSGTGKALHGGESHAANGISGTEGYESRIGSPSRWEEAYSARLLG